MSRPDPMNELSLARGAGNAAVTSPNRRPLALATFMPSRVRILMRPDSNSAIGQDAEQQPADRVVQVADLSADVAVDLGFGESVDDVAGGALGATGAGRRIEDACYT